MPTRERPQLNRRRDPYPLTWEPFVGWTIGLLVFAVLAVQLGRSAANVIAGAGLTWPVATQTVASTIGVIAGNPGAGLAPHPHGRLDSSHLLTCSLLLTGLAVLTCYGWATYRVLRTWGPWRMLGMATREEAERLLGNHRVRTSAHVVRPDLYQHHGGWILHHHLRHHRQHRRHSPARIPNTARGAGGTVAADLARTVASNVVEAVDPRSDAQDLEQDVDQGVERAGSPLGRGLSPRFLPTRTSARRWWSRPEKRFEER